MNIEGNPATVIPRWASAPSDQVSWSSRPSRPATRIGSTKSLALKPVPQMMQSTWRSRPPATTPAGVMRSIASVTTSTLSRCSAGR